MLINYSFKSIGFLTIQTDDYSSILIINTQILIYTWIFSNLIQVSTLYYEPFIYFILLSLEVIKYVIEFGHFIRLITEDTKIVNVFHNH